MSVNILFTLLEPFVNLWSVGSHTWFIVHFSIPTVLHKQQHWTNLIEVTTLQKCQEEAPSEQSNPPPPWSREVSRTTMYFVFWQTERFWKSCVRFRFDVWSLCIKTGYTQWLKLCILIFIQKISGITFCFFLCLSNKWFFYVLWLLVNFSQFGVSIGVFMFNFVTLFWKWIMSLFKEKNATMNHVCS